MSEDYMPDPDPNFHTFFTDLEGWCVDNGATHGLSAGQVTALSNVFDPWNTAWSAHLAAQAAAASATADKKSRRAAAEAVIRSTVAILQTNPAVSDADRATLHITIRDTTRTRAAVPTTRPVLTVDNSQRLQQVVNFRDETTPNSKKKPDGVQGCEIRYFCGDTPPADPEEFEYAGTDTATPYLLVHEAADAGKKCWIVGRWVNTRQEPGPWSESVMSTVSA